MNKDVGNDLLRVGYRINHFVGAGEVMKHEWVGRSLDGTDRRSVPQAFCTVRSTVTCYMLLVLNRSTFCYSSGWYVVLCLATGSVYVILILRGAIVSGAKCAW